jgi:hypothetical protein
MEPRKWTVQRISPTEHRVLVEGQFVALLTDDTYAYTIADAMNALEHQPGVQDAVEAEARLRVERE